MRLGKTELATLERAFAAEINPKSTGMVQGLPTRPRCSLMKKGLIERVEVKEEWAGIGTATFYGYRITHLGIMVFAEHCGKKEEPTCPSP